MSKLISSFEANPPPAGKILIGVLAALLGAGALLVAVILPARYQLDPTGLGAALGLTGSSAPAKTIRIAEVVGGNERYREVPVPDFGAPVPLPNPAVFQKHSGLARVETKTITLQPGEKTEIKAALQAAQVLTFSWRAEGGAVYVDFHGHEPHAGNEYWVRYEEQQSGSEGSGSLVAPFAGEHGWFWMNISEQPVTIKLDVHGYYDKIVDHGLINSDSEASGST